MSDNDKDDATTITGKFRAIRSSVIAGVAVTEYEAQETARYELRDLGQPEQPPELVPVWTPDPNDVDDEDR